MHRLLTVVALAGLAASAAADEVAAVRVRTGAGIDSFTIDNLHGVSSPAQRDNSARRSKTGAAVPPTPGYTFTRRVIAKANRADILNVAANFGGLSLKPMPGAPGYQLITTSSVAQAIALADLLAAAPAISDAYVDIRFPRTYRDAPNDPSLGQQWHLINALDPVFDSNIDAAWDLGFSGLGQTIGIIDGGNAQTLHPDLSSRHLSIASITGAFVGAHATAVAGVACAAGNNLTGGAGAAFNATFGTMPEGSTSQNTAAFAHRNDIIDVKNNSWGPSDNGTIAHIPGAEFSALVTAATTGRNGLGTIVVWAAGNGGLNNDRVDYDPYASSRYIVSIGAIDDDDDASYYNERGVSHLVVAHSNGSGGNRGIFTTDLVGNAGYNPGDYHSNFGGTSSASPLASGIIALMLEANPSLTWRDVQHILIHTARLCDPFDATWTVNGAGYDYSESYGFGAIDAGAAVAAAATWVPVAPETSVQSAVVSVNQVIPDDNPTGVTRTIEVPGGVIIETVELILNADSPFIGDLQITLTSAAGTAAVVATQRSDDGMDFEDQLFTIRSLFGEHSGGTWTVHIADMAAQDVSTWIDARIVVHGIAACAADLTGSSDPNSPDYGVPDGAADASDFFYYLDQFALGNLATADLTGSSDPNSANYGVPDGAADASDFFYYLDQFAAGCP